MTIGRTDNVPKVALHNCITLDQAWIRLMQPILGPVCTSNSIVANFEDVPVLNHVTVIDM